jgi:DNA ligase (NAD+)
MMQLSDFNLEKITPEELGEILISAKKAYYVDSQPIMDDHTFDTLEEILQLKAPHHRIFNKIGSKNFNTGFNKKEHKMPMGSQNKVNSFEKMVHYFELKKITTNNFLVQPKCDGISLALEYQNGLFINAVTRGNGQVGDLISQNVVKMKNFVPILKKSTLSSPNGFTGFIRGEIVVFKKDFQKLNKISTENYSNPRNAASGLSQRLDSKYTEFCSICAVEIFPVQKSESDNVNLLQSLGITTVESHLCHSFQEIETIYQNFLNKKRKKYPYEIDGLVIKINDTDTQKQLGQRDNRPKGQVAYKFPASSTTTKIEKITWQVGPLGTITPVAQVTPVETSGAIITYASLANYDLIKKLNININDIVEISRRGDVIPHIEKVITKVQSGHALAPKYCPICKTKLINDHKFLKCPNSTCLGQTLGVLNLFCKTLDIKNISSKTIKKLFDSKKIKLPGDFYQLTIDDISNLANLGERSAKNIINEIQSKKELTLNQIFDASQIPNFSHARIKQLIDFGFNTPEKLLNLKLIDFDNLPGFKITLAQKIIKGLNLRREMIQSIISQTKLAPQPTNKLANQKLKNLIFCITGNLSLPRKEIIKKIESLGGKFNSSVTSNTNYLLTNETDGNSSKFLSAKKLNVKIITEDEFDRII